MFPRSCRCRFPVHDAGGAYWCWPAPIAAAMTRAYGIQFRRVMDVGGRDLDAPDQPGILVGRDMGLVAVHGLAPAVAHPPRLRIAPNAGRRDQRRVHQGAGAHHDAMRVELARDGLEQRPVQAKAHQGRTETDKGGALGRRLMPCKAAEPAEAGAVVQRLGQAHVRQVVPGGDQECPEQRQRRPTCSPLAAAEMPASKPSTSAQSTKAATSSSNVPPRGPAPSTSSRSCPIRRRAITAFCPDQDNMES